MSVRNQRGFTLIELVMAIAAGAIVAAAVGYAILQLLNMNTRNANYMTAVRNVQTAGYWVSHESQMARPETASVSTPGILLRLTWYDSDNITVTHSCDFTLENGVLYRQRDGGSKILVAEHILSATFDNLQKDDGYIVGFDFNVTAEVTSRGISGIEARRYVVALRPGTQ